MWVPIRVARTVHLIAQHQRLLAHFLGANPNVMARPLAGAMRPHNMLANVEAGLSEPFAETCSGSDQRKSMKNSENRGK